MESVVSEMARLTWEPDQRLLVLSFEGDPSLIPTESAAKVLAGKMEEWLGPSPAPFRVLVDCSRVADSEPGWRAVWGEYFKRHQRAAIMAWFNARPLIRMTITLFVLATRVNGKAFSTEQEAREWVMKQPVEQTVVA